MQTANRKSISIPWNKGKLVGQKHPLKLKEIWEIWIRLQLASDQRGLAIFNLAIDSKLRGCDLVKLKVSDVFQGSRVQSRAIIMHIAQFNLKSLNILERLCRIGLKSQT